MSALETFWVDVCALDDIPLRGARVLKTKAGCIALFRTSENAIFAVDDKCPHQGGPLSQGIVHDNAVTCPLHNLVLDLDTGEARGPSRDKVRTHAAKTADGRVHVDVSGLNSSSAAE